jgi:hypothetical protein
MCGEAAFNPDIQFSLFMYLRADLKSPEGNYKASTI